MLERERLKSIRLFSGIDEKSIVSLLTCISVQQKDYKKGDCIFMSGDTLNQIGLVYQGCVHMVKEDSSGKSSIYVVISEGELFGETFNCSDSFASTVSFWAAADCTILYLPFDRILHACKSDCDLRRQLTVNMIEQIALKNKQFIQKIEIISKKTIQERVLTYLSLQSNIDDNGYFTSSLSRMELADYLCVDRSALTRELSKLKNEGIIDYDKNTYRLL